MYMIPPRYRRLSGLFLGILCLPAAADKLKDSTPPDALAALAQRWRSSPAPTDKDQRLQRVTGLLQELRAMPAAKQPRNCPARWLEAEILMDIADIRHGFDSLADLDQARRLLETCTTDNTAGIAGPAAALLGHLYFMVPIFPISFGDKERAAEYFATALGTAPENLEVNYFYADFLARQGEARTAEKFFRKALAGHIPPGFAALEAGYRKDIAARLATLASTGAAAPIK